VGRGRRRGGRCRDSEAGAATSRIDVGHVAAPLAGVPRALLAHHDAAPPRRLTRPLTEQGSGSRNPLRAVRGLGDDLQFWDASWLADALTAWPTLAAELDPLQTAAPSTTA